MPPNTPAATFTEVQQYLPEYQGARDFYNGDVEEVFSSTRLQRLLGPTGDKFRFNFVRGVVNSLFDRLSIQQVVTGNEQLDEVLENLRTQAESHMDEDDTIRWSLVYGDAYMLVWPGADPEDVRFGYESPETCRVFYDPEDRRRALFAAKAWQDGDHARLNLYFEDRIEKWITKPNAKPSDERAWEPYFDSFRETVAGEPIINVDTDTVVGEYEGGELVPAWPIYHPFGQVPIFHFPVNERPYGRPEHEDAWGPQNVINKVTIIHANVIDVAGFKQRAIVQGEGGGGEADDFDVGTSEQQKAGQRESKLSPLPGSIWWLNAGDEIKEFDPENPDSFLKPYNTYTEALAALTSTPVHIFRGMNGAPSGEALRAAEMPLRHKADRRIKELSGPFAQVYAFALRILAVEEWFAGRGVDWTQAGYGIAYDWTDEFLRWRDEELEIPKVAIEWKTTESAEDKDTAERVRAADAADAMSTETKVATLHPAWTQTQVEEEVARIEGEREAGAALFDDREGDDGDSLQDEIADDVAEDVDA